MSDEHEWVRRLLVEAGQHAETVPPEVAERLDRVLDDLSGAHGAARPTSSTDARPDTARVLPMTPPRRRRWAGALLAAAAVTVGGYAVTASGALEGMSGGAESQSAADSAAGGSLQEEAEPDSSGGAAEGAGDRPSSAGGAESRVQRDLLRSGAADLSSTGLRRDATRLVAAAEDSRAAPSPSRAAGACLPPPPDVPGREIAVTYDGASATAVLRRTGGGRTEVQVWACGSPARLARVVVPG